MKYYMPRPYPLYFTLATIASLILVNFVLVGFTAAGVDPSTLQRLYLLMLTFFLSGSPFIFWEIRRKGRKDSVELGKGYIEWISYTKGIVKVQRLPVADIALFE
ncbi:hypothetical protein [Flavipsychrobacter stenotrophus]|uniref:hypothetical protein n=1 Tax=Flavipsychrobacter stenotrophus TaxID=2077091 RepID=UPI00105716F3|nr:hypothetical protein [Flavipsychrobacter stenotrophus]